MIVRESASYLGMIRGGVSKTAAVHCAVGGSGAPRDRNRHRFRPSLFALEDRRLLTAFTVDSIADSAPASDPAQGTLRWAVEQANEATTPSAIEFSLGSAAATISLSQGQLVLSNSANATSIYDGPGQGPVTISGNNDSRVFWVDDGVTVSMSDLTITGGKVGNFNAGAGLNNDGGTVTLTDCTISGNSALFVSDNGIVNGFYNSTGGGLYNKNGTVTLTGSTISGNYAYAGGGGLDDNGGTATLTDCTISGNSAHDFGGGLDNGSFGILEGGSLGHAAGSTATLSDCTMSGNSAYDGGAFANYGTATLSGCTISGNSAQRSGGAVRNDGTATLSGCAISDNSAFGLENGDYFYRSASLGVGDCTISGNADGGLHNIEGTSTLTDCTVSGNDPSSKESAGVSNSGTAYLTGCTITDNQDDIGAGVANDGKAELTDCTISGNSANVGAVDNEDATITLTGCTISGNTGGGLVDNEATAVLVNSTISGNTTASDGGGIDNYNSSTATLTDCTISGNSAEFGGGLFNAGGDLFSSPSTATLTSTIIAGNTANGTASDISTSGGADVTGTYNLIGTGGSGGLSNGTDGNIVGVANPLLAPLGNYGGPTQTMALLPGSPAIGAGIGVSTVSTDQRAAPRATSGSTDIGAFQDEGYALVVSSGSGQTATVGQAFAAPLVAELMENFANAPLPGATITFSAPATGASATLSASTVVTNANGLASVTATANSVAGSYAVTATTTGITSSASFSLTNSPSGPVNVTSDLSVQFGGLVYNRASRQFTQTLTVTNVSSGALAGPIELVLLDLKNASLVNESGVTQGNPYITILTSGSLGAGQSLSITLVFSDPTLAGISYTAEFLAGAISSDDEAHALDHSHKHLKGDHS
jgi:Right handed beta helix region